MQIEKTVFISYRRTNFYMALAVYQTLSKYGYDVFLDFNNIDSGDFGQVIIDNIKSRAHFVIILTPSALERCHEPNDWLRREIELAIDEKRNIVPLTFEGFDYRSPIIAKYLRGKLELLRNYNSVPVYPEYVSAAMDRLRQCLNIPLELVIHPRSTFAQTVADEARKLADKEESVSEQTLTAQQWFEKGKGYYRANNYPESIICYTEAIELHRDYLYAYYNRGLALKKNGDLDKAILDYSQAINLDPAYAKAYNNRAFAYYEQGKYDEGLLDANKSLQIRPKNSHTLHTRGVILLAMGKVYEAIADFEAALSINPEMVSAINDLAKAKKLLDDKSN